MREVNNDQFKISFMSNVLGLKVTVDVTEAALEPSLQAIMRSNGWKFITFEILVGDKFPFIFPRLTCLSHVNPTRGRIQLA